MVEFYLLTFPRFPLQKKEHISYFGKNRTHDFRTSRCADYLLDYSGDKTVETVVRTQRHRLDAETFSCCSRLLVGPGKGTVAIWIPVGLSSGLLP